MSQNTGDQILEMCTSIEDFETSQYKVLGALRKYSTSFNEKRIYPALAELIALKMKLTELVGKESELKSEFPKNIVGFDIENKKSIYENTYFSDRLIEEVVEFINWSLPKINEMLEEGIAIFDFIDDNIALEQIGILPMYKEEGYLAIPDRQVGEIKVYRYESSIFSSQEEKYRSLKVNFLYSIPNLMLVDTISQTIKTELKNKFSDLPTPAVFSANTDLDFPFVQSIFPVVKRKFIKHLATQ